MPSTPPAPGAASHVLSGRRPVEIVDIGANPIDGEPPYAPLLEQGVARVTGFEPQESAYAELTTREDGAHRYLPYAVGDGAEHTLRLCVESGFASMLEPDRAQLGLLTDFPRMASVTDRIPMATRRLDDITEIEQLDYLKIDIQGGELDVFRHGRRLLARAVAVQTEVGFTRLYEDQPTFADLDLELRAHGFVPHLFVNTKTWPLAPLQWADPLQEQARHLVEADVLYVRDLARLDVLSEDQLHHLGLICDLAYASYGVTLLCIAELVRRGVLDPDSARIFRDQVAVRAQPTPSR
ncbi:FkbM family methyltransferase [Allobranchiibius huperziae]|uniref:FkbM family methyltransferase n=1 Tax=Allobranchiibius huperziae TaxID=1874116 RepID=A0A853DAH7_9MICO|nr:FkbM family methyltransferase [Allobranchiibius huperziae]